MRNFEEDILRKIDRGRDITTEGLKLKYLLENIQKVIKKEFKDIPITESLRIDFGKFPYASNEDLIWLKRIVYTIENVNIEEEKSEEVEVGRFIKEALEDREIITDGERMEVFKTILFHKFIGKNFIVVRSSIYDDFKNKVDNVIINKETGEVVCAFDEVCLRDSNFDSRKKDKKNIIFEKNRRGGAKIKYGLFLQKENDKMVLKKGEIQGVPIFYLSLEKNDLDDGIKSLAWSLDKISEKEKEIWEKFKILLKEQGEEIIKEPGVSKDIKSKVKNFFEDFSKII
jgi:hypothetical protein